MRHSYRPDIPPQPQPYRTQVLCVVREWTDDSRRGADGTAHKMNWTKPLGHGGPPLEDWKVSWRGWQVRLA
jgi:hypothetical protein